jgi:L-malate glycosyltransferase
LRILYFSRDFTPHDQRFLSSLAATPHKVFWLRLEKRRRMQQEPALPPQVIQVPWRGGREEFRWKQAAGRVWELRRLLSELKPDLVNAGPVPDVAFLAALSGFSPLVSMSWGSDLLLDVDRSRWQRLCADYALHRSSVLLGDCQAVKDKAVGMGFEPGRVVIFPWGVDLERFCPGPADGLRAGLGWQNAFVVLSLRSWEPVYGIEVLLKGFFAAARQAPALRLLLFGGGSQEGLVRQLLAESGLEERVHLGGQVQNEALPQVYRSADLYASASHSDGSSVSLMEALACGKPALVSDIPGNREWIGPGGPGWLFPDGDLQALADGILSAAHQRSSLGSLGAAARALAEERADWRKNFQIMLDGYEKAVQWNRELHELR